MIRIIDTCLSVLLAALMAAMVLDVTWQILTRFLTSSPSSWTEEMARFLLIWIGLLGAAWAYRRKAHLGLSYFADKLDPPARQKLDLFGYFAAALFAILVMIYGGGQLVMLTLSLDQYSPSLGWPIGYVYLATPLSGALITIYALDFARESLSGQTPAETEED